ncbi:MAG TPA: prepilin peptidase [Candidatus Obscuribacterales bacterium]
MDTLVQNPPLLYALTFVIGACVGSFLNVLALRSLAETSLFHPASHCPKCKRNLHPFDLIPILSYFLLGGKCRFCCQSISWHYPFVEFFTASWFVLIVYYFGLTPDAVGMLYFSSALIAVCITDFREKLIPHEITYPSIIIGIIFSSVYRQDLLGTMAGIGASYIIFDFLAFYGLKLYLMQHPELAEGAKAKSGSANSTGSGAGAQETTLRGAEITLSSNPENARQPQEVAAGPLTTTQQEIATAAASETAGSAEQALINETDAQTQQEIAAAAASEKAGSAEQAQANEAASVTEVSMPAASNVECASEREEAKKATVITTKGESAKEEEEEEIEVMGGGDAVLSALISAWLGWQSLCVALFIGFIVGCLMGATYLMMEMRKQGILSECIRPAIIGFVISFTVIFALLFAIVRVFNPAEPIAASIQAVLIGALIAGVFGALVGAVRAGTKVSKPFPFGPALAIGAAIAIFYPADSGLGIMNSEMQAIGGTKKPPRLWQMKPMNSEIMH